MILERLEKLPVGSFHYKLLMVTGLGWLFDSMDTGLIAFVLPVLAKEWGLTTAQMGWIGSIGLIGMALGAIISGTVADKIGRKKVFSITVLLYSLATGACALAWSYESLLVFRFLVGFGLGGELPVAATLMSVCTIPSAGQVHCAFGKLLGCRLAGGCLHFLFDYSKIWLADCLCFRHLACTLCIFNPPPHA